MSKKANGVLTAVRRSRGGASVSHNKNTAEMPIERMPVPSRVVLPMQQHIGAPCTPLVEVGDKVLRGQKIGDGEGLCVPVHASVSGKVVAIEPRPHPLGDLIPAVVIENDFEDEEDLDDLEFPGDAAFEDVEEEEVI